MTHTAEPRLQRKPLVERGKIHHHAADMAVTASADVTLGALQARLGREGQWIAVDGDLQQPLGQLLLEDSTGPLRLGYGGWRDFLTGVQFTDGRGNLVTVGGITVKNVAGYDLVKFLVGSQGCFGTPVTLTCRTYRRPEASIGADLGTHWDAARLSDLLASDAPPQWLLLSPDGLRAGWLGRQREMEQITPIVAQLAGGAATLRSLAEDDAERRGLLDVGVPRARVVAAPASIWALFAGKTGAPWVADPAFGIAWCKDHERFSNLLADVHATGGSVIRVGGQPDGSPLPHATRRLLENLKSQLDPDARLPPLPKQE